MYADFIKSAETLGGKDENFCKANVVCYGSGRNVVGMRKERG